MAVLSAIGGGAQGFSAPGAATGGASAVTPLRPPPTGPGASLPPVLLESVAAHVIHGTDPGGFYCEHMFYLAQREAGARGTHVAKNAAGERLVGFLHFPDDPFSGGGGASSLGEPPYTQAERHAGAREVVGAALRGYFQDAAADPKREPVRILLTGYGPFMSIADNPTGDFVAHRENVDAALRQAFGADLLTPEGEVVPAKGKKAAKVGAQTGAEGAAAAPAGGPASEATTLRYRVRDAATGKERSLEVRLERFPVTDATLDPSGPRSIQRSMREFRPHAVLSMGIASGPSFKAEHHADDEGLSLEGGPPRHDGAREARHAQPENYSLARAIWRGGGAPAPRPASPAPVPSPLPPNVA